MVTAYQGVATATQLIAYVTSDEGVQVKVLREQLAHTLRQTLPEYMVPAEFIFLRQLPRTVNGKIDRTALPAPFPVRLPKTAAMFAGPVTPAQKMLAKIWSEVLEVNPVGITNSLFDLGADSLLIFRIAARAQREGLPVTATLLFQQKTIAGVCTALEQGNNVPGVLQRPRIAAVERERYRIAKVGGLR